ncbi:hypothetical protein FH972_019898 [Carpinus fangiana]|uniref:Uncharacterized protein n=1 Tax=Carpinus fangiana TaxID=176857 RepID=A0A5N6RUN5_9ROSI|nr:hypothetical protein FH972_019898 [Carpinus fangiana]
MKDAPSPIAKRGWRRHSQTENSIEASSALEAPASVCTGREKVPSKTQSSPGMALASVEEGGCHRKTQSLPGMTHASMEVGVCHRNSRVLAAKQSAQVAQSQAISSAGVTCPIIQGKVKGREESSLNAKLELGCLREWLSRIRGEVDAGLVRVDAVLKVLESDGPGQERRASDWISKPVRKNKYKGKKPLVHKVGVGSELGPLVVKAILQPKSHMSAGAGTSTSMGLVEGPVLSPGVSGGPGEVKDSLQPNSHIYADAGICAGMGLAKGPVLSSGVTGPVNEGLGLSKTGENTQQRPGNMENSLEVQSDHETGGGMGVSQVEGDSGSPRKTGAVPARGAGANLGVKGFLNRPNNSWVAGRTDFGPLVTGEDTGVLAQVAHSKAGAAPTVLMASMQTDDYSVVDRRVEAISVGVGAFDQVITTRDAIAVMKVYRRRDGLLHGHLKGLEKTKGVDLALGSVSPGVGVLDGGVPEGGLEEMVVEGEVDDTGMGMRIDEMEDPYVTRKWKLAVEVSNIAGLSYDG